MSPFLDNVTVSREMACIMGNNDVQLNYKFVNEKIKKRDDIKGMIINLYVTNVKYTAFLTTTKFRKALFE